MLLPNRVTKKKNPPRPGAATAPAPKTRAAKAKETSSPIGEIERLCAAVVSGRLDARCDAAKLSGDWSTAAVAINTMLDALEARAVENQRARSAVDAVTSSVMIADADGVVRYANGSVLEMLRAAEDDLRKDLPEFRTAKVVGSNIDIFHKNPARQRNMLGGLTAVHRAQITVGGRVFSLVATPLFDEQKKRTGTAVEWLDRTTEARIEKELAVAIEAASRGDFSLRIDMTGADGVFKLLGGHINSLLENTNTCLDTIGAALNRIAEGDVSRAVEGAFNGAFAKLQSDAETVRRNLQALIDDANNMAEGAQQGRLDTRVDSDRHQGDFRKIISAFERALEGINDTLYEIVDAVEQVGESSDRLNGASQGMASNSQEQASAVEEITSSLTQTNSQVQANTANANAANQLVIGASQTAAEGQAKMENMNDAMNAIKLASHNIGRIIKVIDEIAFQTNLLALNAAVEAARAGQHGRGFAVVAQEVRNLAGRSAKAARETADMIEDTVRRVNEGVTIADATRQALDLIVTNVVKVKDLVSEIAIASDEQSRGVAQINVAMSQVAKAAQDSSKQADELASSSTELAGLAEQMINSVRHFKLRERAGAPAVTLNGLEQLSRDEMLEKLKSMIASVEPAPRQKAVAAAGGRRKQVPHSVIPLDADERGFGGF